MDLGKEGKQKPMRQDGRFFWTGSISLDYYTNEFEKPFLERTAQNFALKASQWNLMYNCEQILRRIHQTLAKEEENADAWLQHVTKDKMLRII